MYKRTAERFEELRQQMEREHTSLGDAYQELQNQTSLIVQSINKISLDIAELRKENVKQISALNARIDALDQKVEAITESENATSAKMQKNAKAMKDVVRAVNETVTEVNSTTSDTVDKLTAMCTEMLSEYRRSVNESISLLMTDDLVRKIPGKAK